MLIAKQNPLDIVGTSRLSEGSFDRFAAVVTPGRAPTASEIDVLAGRQGRTKLDAVRPFASLDKITRVQSFVSCTHVADVLAEYVVALLDATRRHPVVRLGAPTRGGVALLALARARAVMNGCTYVVPDDTAALAVSALTHRIVLADANSSLDNGRALMAECLAAVPPHPPQRCDRFDDDGAAAARGYLGRDPCVRRRLVRRHSHCATDRSGSGSPRSCCRPRGVGCSCTQQHPEHALGDLGAAPYGRDC